MRKAIILLVAIMLIGLTGCSKSTTEEKVGKMQQFSRVCTFAAQTWLNCN